MYTYTYIYTYIHTYIYIYIYMYICEHSNHYAILVQYIFISLVVP